MNQAQVTAQLQRRVSEMVEAANRHDVAAYDAVFAADADFIDTSGGLTSGRAAIAAVHKEEFATRLAGLKIENESVAVRPLSDQAAVVRIENRFQPGDRRVVMTAVFVKHGEDWQIVAGHASRRSSCSGGPSARCPGGGSFSGGPRPEPDVPVSGHPALQ